MMSRKWWDDAPERIVGPTCNMLMLSEDGSLILSTLHVVYMYPWKKRSSLATQEPDLPPLQSYPTLGPSSDDRPNCLIASPYDACESCDTLRQHYAVKLPIYDKVVVYSCRVSSSLYIYFNIHISSSSLILFVHAYMLVLQGRKRGGGN